MAQSRSESTRDIYNHGKYINRFPPNTIKAIRQYNRINKKICWQKMSIMINEICINEEMLPIYIYIYIYIRRSLNNFVDWCIVLVEMPLTRFEECWPLPMESLPELPYDLNIVTLTVWPINSGVLTSLLLPHLSSSLTDSLPSLNLLCHSKTDARFMQDGRKAVRSIPYIYVASFFPSFKQNFIAYRSSKGSRHPECIFEIH